MMDMLAQSTTLLSNEGMMAVGAGLGAGLTTLGAAKGIGLLASNAVESIARQPEAGGRVFTSMIIAAALIEGFTFFSLVVCNGIVGHIGKMVGG